MQQLFSRRVGLSFLLFLCGFYQLGCATSGTGGDASAVQRFENQTVHARVGMRVEPTRGEEGWHMFSTNHIGLPKHVPAGSQLRVRSTGRSSMKFLAEDNSVITVDFVARHHPDLTFDAWLDRQFSFSPVTSPGDLSSAERTAIQEGRYERGMSRAALFLAIGYPPSTLSPSITDPDLRYDVKRFNSISFTFDAQDRLSNIRH